MAFHCTVVTPEKPIFEGTIVQAIVAAHDGSAGVLTNRAPLLMRLGVGALRLDLPDGQKRYFLIDGGVAQMRQNILTILTDQASAAEDLDPAQADAEFAAAAARPITDDQSFAQRQRQLQRARAIRELAGR